MTLVRHYVCDENSGTTAYDYSGNEQHGTMNNGAGPSGTGTVTGPFGNSVYDYDGNGDYVDLPTLPNFSAYTVCFWMKIRNFTSDGVVAIRENNGTLFRASGSPDRLEMFHDTGATNQLPAAPELNTGTWYHVAITWDGSTSRAYIDAKLEGSESISTNSADSQGDSIGRENNSVSGQLRGQVSDLRIYDRALSPQELQALYQAGVQSEVIFE